MRWWTSSFVPYQSEVIISSIVVIGSISSISGMSVICSIGDIGGTIGISGIGGIGGISGIGGNRGIGRISGICIMCKIGSISGIRVICSIGSIGCKKSTSYIPSPSLRAHIIRKPCYIEPYMFSTRCVIIRLFWLCDTTLKKKTHLLHLMLTRVVQCSSSARGPWSSVKLVRPGGWETGNGSQWQNVRTPTRSVLYHRPPYGCLSSLNIYIAAACQRNRKRGDAAGGGQAN